MELSGFEDYVERQDGWLVLDVECFAPVVEAVLLDDKMAQEIEQQLQPLLVEGMEAHGLPIWQQGQWVDSLAVVRLTVSAYWTKLRRRGQAAVLVAALSFAVERWVAMPDGEKVRVLQATVWEAGPAKARVATTFEELMKELKFVVSWCIEELVEDWKQRKEGS